MSGESIFCLFYATGSEKKVTAFLKKLGYAVISSVSERNVFKDGKFIKEYRPIIPGYAFFSNAGEPNWEKINEFKCAYFCPAYNLRINGSMSEIPYSICEVNKVLIEETELFIEKLYKADKKLFIEKYLNDSRSHED
jgi:hypothetical protein